MTGFLLGGGFSLMQSLQGLAIDNLVSLRMISAAGEIVTCSETENQDIFWGVRGAGKHFGLVLDYELKIFPLEVLGGVKKGDVWVARVLFSPDQIEKVAEAIIELEITDRMVCAFNYACPPPAFEV
jgi:FAD/FMN-containing dehydrogenase